MFTVYYSYADFIVIRKTHIPNILFR